MLLAGGYLFLITQNLILSVILSLLVSVVGFFYVVFLPKKLEREQHLFRELHKYATTMTFYMQSGDNVMQSLEASKEGLDDEVQQDIQRTLDYLRENAELNTAHYEEYKIPAIDIFHQTLKINMKLVGIDRKSDG